jgi:hypothetical protein
MQLSSASAADSVLRACLSAVLLAFLAFFSLTLPRARPERARVSSCQSNLRQLQLAAQEYAQDYDDHLPPRPAPDGDFVAFHWSAVSMDMGLRHSYHIAAPAGGPLWDYAKNACINRCPSDPDNFVNSYAAGAHSSYRWNIALSGKLLEDVPGKPLAWDRAPFHGGARNVIRTGGQAETLPEQGFQALVGRSQ